MTMFRHFLKKEFLQIFRNRIMLPILIAMPVIQLLILANAATFELREIPVYIADQDQSTSSRSVMGTLENSGFFKVEGIGASVDYGLDLIARNEIRMVLVIPTGMEYQLVTTGTTKVQVLIDAVDGFAAGVAQQYITRLLSEIQLEVLDVGGVSTHRDISGAVPFIDVRWSYWYNHELEYIRFMVPGILVVLVTMIGGFLSGMNVVRERELGTMEQLNVTPITRAVFIAGKLVPFWIIAMIELAFGLMVAWLVFDLVAEGSLWLIFAAAGIFLIAILGMSLFISTISDTQQQAMLITWFIMVLFILMGGLFTPIESMPLWAQKITLFNPLAWFIDLMRRVMLTGASFEHIYQSILVMLIMGITLLSLAVFRYRKTA